MGSSIRMSMRAGPSSVQHALSAEKNQTLLNVPRAYPEGSPCLADCFTYSVDDLQRESCPIFYAATIVVCPCVRHVLRELVDEVPVSAMYFDAVEASMAHCASCGFREGFHILLYLCDMSLVGLYIRSNSILPALVRGRGFSSLPAIGTSDAETY